MHNNIRKTVLALLFILAMLFSAASAEQVELVVDGNRYTMEIPEEYAVYTSALGKDSSYVKFTGYEETGVLDDYMKGLGCCLVGVERTYYHQIWLSIKDRSEGLGQNPEERLIRAYYDGVAMGRGAYTVEQYNGHDYYVFASGKSIYENGINYYISTFFGNYEVALRWESETGKRTEEDIELLKAIIHSVQPMNE